MSKNIDLVGRLSERIDLNASTIAPFPRTNVVPPSIDEDAAVLERASTDAISAPAAESPARPSEIIPFELDLTELSAQGFLTSENSKSLTAEEYRVIKRPLLRAAFNGARKHGDRGHVIMVTSARPNDGKTFTALNLAMSIASERDLQVLLVDADVRHKGLSKTLAMVDKTGFMDVLTDPKLTLADVILNTNIPRLAVIPAGQKNEHPTETFASQRMASIMREMATRYADRLIIFDTPPVLATSDSAVLAGHMGQAIMVVLANETSKRAIIEALALIDTCPSVSFILNKMALTPGFERFGSYGDYT